MTLHFTQINRLAQTFERVYASQAGETLSATNCVLITQQEHQTQFTTIEPGRAAFQRFYHHDNEEGGTEGAVYLIDQGEFKTKLAKVKAAGVRSLTLKATRTRLSLIANYSVVDGAARESGSLTLRQYGGAHSDFPTFPESGTLIATLDTTAFERWLELVIQFREVSNEQKFEGDAIGRTILLEFSASTLNALTNHKGTYRAYLNAQVASVSARQETLKVGIESRQIKRLQRLSETAPVTVSENKIDGDTWLTFSGDAGKIALKTAVIEQSLQIDYALFTPDPRVITEATRQFTLPDLETAVALQLPDESQLQKDLILAEQGPSLVLVQAANIAGHEHSKVDIDPAVLEGEWTDVLVNAQTLKASLRVLRTYLHKLQLNTNSIVLQQKSLRRPSGTKGWLLICQPALVDPQIQASLLIIMKPAESNIDLINTEE